MDTPDYSEYSKEELIQRVTELESIIKEIPVNAEQADDSSAMALGMEGFGEIFGQLLGSDITNLYSDYVIAMLNNMTVPAYFADTDAVVMGCNKYFEALLGMTADEIKFNILGNIMPEFPIEGEDIPTEETDDDPEMINYEAVITDKNGSQKEVVISKSIVKNMDGSVAGVIGVINDITEKRAAEKALVESEQRLREANATKDRFFSIISHDLRSPFASILGFTDTLITMYPELTDEEKYSFIQDVADSAKKAYRLVENLLAWSRTQLGELTIAPVPVQLLPIVSDLIDLYSPLARQRNMELTCNISAETIILADEQTITLVLRNLVNNAVKFNRDGEAIHISADEDNGRVIIRLRDHGIGISKEDIGKLFRIDTNSKVGNSPHKGSGLGLILCKQFVEKNGGTIEVTSEPGSFTEFTISLPSITAATA
ncbi:MAG: ATP-binding protein [Ignavibacteria bacterium]|nr:ATP-binding protein [Ignavibacteria bacterium]